MARAKLRVGDLGTIRIIRLPSGKYQAQARLCDEVGKSHQVKASGTTEALAETALREKADSIRGDTGGLTLGKNATVAEVGAVFLYDKGRSGMVEDSTMEAYEQAVRCVVVPACGDLLLRDFTARRCNRILAVARAESVVLLVGHHLACSDQERIGRGRRFAGVQVECSYPVQPGPHGIVWRPNEYEKAADGIGLNRVADGFQLTLLVGMQNDVGLRARRLISANAAGRLQLRP